MSIGIEISNINSTPMPKPTAAGAPVSRRTAGKLKFGTFTCRCPTTQRVIESGIEMDRRTFRKIGKYSVRVHCDACREVHVLRIDSGMLAPLGPDKRRPE